MHKFSKAAKAVALMASVVFVTGVINAQGDHRESAAKIIQTTGKQIYAVKRVAGSSESLRNNFNMASALAKKTVEEASFVPTTHLTAKMQAKNDSSVRKASTNATTTSAKTNSTTSSKPSTNTSTANSSVITTNTKPGTTNSSASTSSASTKSASSLTHKKTQGSPTESATKQDTEQVSSSSAGNKAAKAATNHNTAQKANADSTTSTQQRTSQTLQTANNFSQVSTYWKSSGSHEKKAQSNYKMRIYSEPDKKGKVVASVAVADNFTVEQGDWVRVKTASGQVGWALVRDVEKNINEAWNDEYQVIINGPSSNYSVNKVSPEERMKRQQAMRERQMARMQKLSRLWEQDFFDFDASDETTRNDEIQSLKKQVVALNTQLKHLQDVDQDKS